MQLLILLSLLLAVMVCVVLGANNASACVETSAGIVSMEYLVLATAGGLGIIAGAVVEGGKLSNAVYGGVLFSPSNKATAIVLLATLIVMLVATILNLPLSLTQAMVGAALPIGLLLELGVNWRFFALVAVSWATAPFVAAAFSIVIYQVTRLTSRRMGSVFRRARMYAAMTLGGSFYVGYALGANGVGLVDGISKSVINTPLVFSVLLSIASVTGIYLFGYGVVRTVSERILALAGSAALAAQLGGALTVHLFTQLGVPVSIIQATIGGIAGIGQAKDIAIMNRRIVLRIVLGWVVAPLTGLALAWLLLTLT